MTTRRVVVGALVVAAALALHVVAATTYLFWPSREVPRFAEVRASWRPSEAYLLDRHGEVIDSVRVDFGARRAEWVALANVSPALAAAVVDGEDRRFRRHSGVDWLGGIAAADTWLGRVGPGRGASTITMQVAHLVDPKVAGAGLRGSIARKLAQIRSARGIEAHWSKDEILETYLNLVWFRGELQGIGAAASVLARKQPSGLDLPESMVLAALLPAPTATTEGVASRACARASAGAASVPCETLRATAAQLLDRGTASSGVVPSSGSRLRASHDVGLAPHVARLLLRAPGERVQSTLDARLQRRTLEALDRHLARLATQNVRDGAAIVVDNATGEVLAYVGSAGAGSRARHVDGVRARRQAGSTLKPFLYELAIERRILTAASLLDDSPVHLETPGGIYLPQDYDRDYKGLVSVRTALASSLNIPAIRAIVMTGVEPFRERLQRVGYEGIDRDAGFYGYSLALGSAEVSLWEQAQAYRTLARGGLWSSLSLRAVAPNAAPGAAPNEAPNAARASDRVVLAPDATWIVADVLSDRAARTLTFGLANHLNTSYWSAAKTGTSKDMRDNWCVGFSQRLTVAVWVGNFEGDSMHDVSGVSGAAPAWREIMAAAHTAELPGAPAIPSGVHSAQTEFSPALEPPRAEWFLADTAEATQRTRVVALAASDEIARIASPADGIVVAIDPDIPPALQRLPFFAEGAGGSARFVLNGKALGSAARGVLWEPRIGRHRLVLENAAGAPLDQVLFTVR